MKPLVLSALALLLPCSGQQRQAVPQTFSAGDVFARFCELDSRGLQLTPEGWQRIAALFVNPGVPHHKRIIVSDGGGPLRPAPEGEKIGVGREYIEFGQIALPQVRFSAVDGLPPGVKIRGEVMHEVKMSGPNGVAEWRIEGPVPEPVVGVEAAILYVTRLRENAEDAVTKKNADRTLAALRHFR